MKVSVTLSIEVDLDEWAEHRNWGHVTAKAVRESVQWSALNHIRSEPGVVSASLRKKS